MFRRLRAPIGGLSMLVAAACVAAPAGAPVPADATPAQFRAADLQEQCRRSADRSDCYSGALLSVLEDEGVEEAMLTLEHLAERDAKVQREGHMYAHHIGLAASPSPDEVGATFRQCRPSFQSGCYHGVVQSYFADLVSTGSGVDAEAAEALCADYRGSGDDRWLLFQCVHGMGHGLTMLHDYHLPSALAGCDLLTESWDREGCYGGVFMESIVNATTPHHAVGRPHAESHDGGSRPGASGAEMAEHTGSHPGGGPAAHAHAHGESAASEPDAEAGGQDVSGGHEGHGEHAPVSSMAMMAHEPFPALDRRDPLYPCTALAERYLVACYQMQTSAVLFHNGSDVEATAAACNEAPEKYRGYCYLSLGRDVSALTQQDHAEARIACSAGDPEYHVWCHTGYVKNLVDLTADPEEALEYCADLVDGPIRQACYHAVGEEIWVLTSSRSRGEAWCAKAERADREYCRRGAGLASWRDAAVP